MEYKYSGDKIVVTCRKCIVVGDMCRLHGSYTYAAEIPEGIVRIIDILTNIEYDSAHSSIQAWVDAICPGGIYDPDTKYDYYIQTMLDEYFDNPWIVARYNDTRELIYMPLIEFIGHSSRA